VGATARQIEDRELEEFALRIRARAICRSGEASRVSHTPEQPFDFSTRSKGKLAIASL
jgi:hypothetical protein